MKKIITLVLTLAMVIGCFAGCGDESKTASTSSEESKKILVMGTNATFPPYEYVDDNGKIIGIDAEIAAAVAEKMGMELDIRDMEFDSLVTAVANKTIDIALAGLTVSEERKLSVDFSDTYATGVQVVIVKEDSAIKSIDDLKGKKIGVQAGTTGDIYCTEDFGQDYVKQYSSGALAVAALKNGQVDCVVIDDEPAKNFVKVNEGLKVLDTEYAVEDYAAAISKENTELKDNFNKALKELKDEGKLAEIINKYIPAEE